MTPVSGWSERPGELSCYLDLSLLSSEVVSSEFPGIQFRGGKRWNPMFPKYTDITWNWWSDLQGCRGRREPEDSMTYHWHTSSPLTPKHSHTHLRHPLQPAHHPAEVSQGTFLVGQGHWQAGALPSEPQKGNSTDAIPHALQTRQRYILPMLTTRPKEVVFFKTNAAILLLLFSSWGKLSPSFLEVLSEQLPYR